MEDCNNMTKDNSHKYFSGKEKKLINDMVNNKYSHLETAMEYEKKIYMIQKSSHVAFYKFSFLHNYLRMKYSWYYKWHLKNNFNFIHFSILLAFIVLIVIIIYFKFVYV